MPLVILLVGVFILSSGCTSSNGTASSTTISTSFSNVKTLTNGDEKISIELAGTPYWAESGCQPVGCYDMAFIVPVKVKNVGSVGIDNIGYPRLTYELIDYAGFKKTDHKAIGKMYPGDEYTSNVTFSWAWWSDEVFKDRNCDRNPAGCEGLRNAYRKVPYDEIQKMGTHDLTLRVAFGKDSATWTIPASTFQTVPTP